MNSENENPNSDPNPAPAEHPAPPVFPPDRIETHSDPFGPIKFPPMPRPEKKDK